MEQASPDVVEHGACTDSDTDGIDGFDDSVDDVWACLEQVGNEQVEQVQHGVFAAEANDTKSHVLDDGGTGLTMDLVAVDQGVFK